jgi:hypothetical protein
MRPIEDIHYMEVDFSETAAAMTRLQPWLREWVGL